MNHNLYDSVIAKSTFHPGIKFTPPQPLFTSDDFEDVWKNWAKKRINKGHVISVEEVCEGQHCILQWNGLEALVYTSASRINLAKNHPTVVEELKKIGPCILEVSLKGSSIKAFDILYYQEQNLTDLSLNKRQEYLAKAIQNTLITKVETHTANSKDSLKKLINGRRVMLKTLSSKFEFEVNQNWVMLKGGEGSGRYPKGSGSPEVSTGARLSADEVANLKEDATTLEVLHGTSIQAAEKIIAEGIQKQNYHNYGKELMYGDRLQKVFVTRSREYAGFFGRMASIEANPPGKRTFAVVKARIPKSYFTQSAQPDTETESKFNYILPEVKKEWIVGFATFQRSLSTIIFYIPMSIENAQKLQIVMPKRKIKLIIKKENIQQIVSLPEWQSLRTQLIGQWKENPAASVGKLREFLGPVRDASDRKLRIIHNYLTGSGFRIGVISHPAITELLTAVRNEVVRRRKENKISKGGEGSGRYPKGSGDPEPTSSSSTSGFSRDPYKEMNTLTGVEMDNPGKVKVKLEKGKFETIKNIRDIKGSNPGINETYFVKISGDGEGVVKPGDLDIVQNEVTADTVDDELGLNIVPPTTARVVNIPVGPAGGIHESDTPVSQRKPATSGEERAASIQAKVNDTQSFTQFERTEIWGKMPLGTRPQGKMEVIDPVDFVKLDILDRVIGNEDRHGGNFLVTNKKDSNGFHKLVAIDHGYSISQFNNRSHLEEIGNQALRVPGLKINRSELNQLKEHVRSFNFDNLLKRTYEGKPKNYLVNARKRVAEIKRDRYWNQIDIYIAGKRSAA